MGKLSVFVPLLVSLILAGCTATEPPVESATAGGDPNTTLQDDPGAEDLPPVETNATAEARAPWNVTAEVTLGWARGVGVSQGEPLAGAEDASYCPRATFLVPNGTRTLALVIRSTHLSPSGPGAGTYSIHLTDPEGKTVYLEPALGNHGWTRESPAEGEWRLFARPIGPVVNQKWPVEVTLGGESPEAPSAWSITLGCA